MIFIYIFVITLNTILSVIPLIFGKKNIANLAFSASSFFLSFWSLGNYFLFTSNSPIFWEKFCISSTIMFTLFFFIFITQHPKQLITLNLKQLSIISILPIIFLIFMPTKFIVEEAFDFLKITYGIGYYFVFIYFVIYIGTSLIIIIRGLTKYKNSHSLSLQYLFVGIVLSVTGASITNLILPLFFEISIYQSIGPLFTSILILLTSISIVKKNLLDLKVVIQKAPAYISTVLLSLFTFYIASYYTYNNRLLNLTAIFLLAIFWTTFGVKVKNLLITTARKAFIKGWYDSSAFKTEITDALAPVMQRDQLFSIISDKLDHIIGISKVTVISACRSVVDKSIIDVYSGGAIEIDKKCEFIQFVESKRETIKTKALEKNLFHGLQEKVMQLILDSRILLPIHSYNGLEAIILLDHKDNGTKYNISDVETLNTLIKQTSVAIDRIMLYEELQMDFEKSQVVAREATDNRNFAEMTKQLAHEINNPLGIILGSASNTIKFANKEEFKTKDIVLELQNDIVAVVKRIQDTAKAIMSFNATDELHLEKVDVNDLIRKNTQILSDSIKINLDLAEDVPTIMGDVSAFGIMLINLLINAKQAIEEANNAAGEIGIKSYLTEFEKDDNVTRVGVCIEISDNGVGMTKEETLQVFRPYYTTKAEGHGLGMSHVFKLVEAHNGKLSLSSEKRQGSTIFIHLPVG
jgi:signal transduction histidine kinase